MGWAGSPDEGGLDVEDEGGPGTDDHSGLDAYDHGGLDAEDEAEGCRLGALGHLGEGGCGGGGLSLEQDEGGVEAGGSYYS